MNQNFVYILKCSDESYYIGVTNDLERRIWEHKTGYNSKSYTFHRRPLKLVYQNRFKDINQAISFEKQIKGWTRKKKEALIEDNWNEIVKLSNHNKSLSTLRQPFDRLKMTKGDNQAHFEKSNKNDK